MHEKHKVVKKYKKRKEKNRKLITKKKQANEVLNEHERMLPKTNDTCKSEVAEQ